MRDVMLSMCGMLVGVSVGLSLYKVYVDEPHTCRCPATAQTCKDMGDGWTVCEAHEVGTYRCVSMPPNVPPPDVCGMCERVKEEAKP